MSKNQRIYCFGEVLWDILPEGKYIGGAPLNVAYHLKHLALDPLMITRIGSDPLGDKIKKFFQKNELSTSYLQIDSKHPTSTVEARVDSQDEVSYKFMDDIAWDFIEWNDSLKKLSGDQNLLVFGSLATRHKETRETLFKLLDYPFKKVMDVNLRPPFYSKELIYDLMKHADIVKMNEQELKIISDWNDLSGDDQTQMKSIKKRFDIEILMVTYGSEGAYLIQKGAIYYERGKEIEIADTVGSGDAFLAGFLSVYVGGGAGQEALKVANQMGAFIATKDGGCPEYNLKEINK